MTFPDIFKGFFMLLIGAAAGYYFLSYQAPERNFSGKIIPCQQPLMYSIGSIDTRFGINKSDVAEAMRLASALWSEELGRPAAVYSDEGNVIVSFVYDERQQLVDGEMRFRERIESEQLRLDQFHRDYERLKQRFNEQSESYTRFARETTRDIDALNEWVSQRNGAGGLTERDASRFEEQKQEIERKQQQVLHAKSELDRMANQLNRSAEQLNRISAENNRLIDQYNEEFSGENRFTKATYQNLPDGGAITVSTYLSKSELVLILAHELGHAFGLEHLPNSKSVMHSLMGGQELFPILQLTEEDKESIRNICN